MPVDDRDAMAALDALLARLKAAGPLIEKDIAHTAQGLGMGRTPVRTGTLRRSWQVKHGVDSTNVGPTMVYARRIELGFHGRDSIGRIYRHDPGHPYVRPAADDTRRLAPNIAIKRIREAIRG